MFTFVSCKEGVFSFDQDLSWKILSLAVSNQPQKKPLNMLLLHLPIKLKCRAKIGIVAL